MKTKREVLEANGWEVTNGYEVCTDKNPDYNNVIVSREELLELLKKEPDNYYWKDNHCYDVMHDEETAWEYFFEDWCDENLNDTQDIKFEDWEKKILE
jgi:hypothetical protein